MKEKNIGIFIIVILLIFFLYFSLIAILNYYNLNYYWDVCHIQKLFESIINFSNIPNYLYISGYGQEKLFFDHLYFTVLVILPFYYIFQNPITLYIIQNIFLIVGSYLFYYLAHRKLGLSKFKAMFCVLIILLHPTVQGTSIITFHATSIIMLLCPLLFIFFYSNKRISYYTVTLLIIFTREDFALLIIGWNLIVMFKYKKFKEPLVLILFSLVYLSLAIFMILPNLLTQGTEHLHFKYYYSYLGNSYFDIIKNLPKNYHIILKELFSKKSIFVYFILLAPFGFLSLYRIYYLIPIIPLLCLNLLSLFTGMSDPKLYYYIPVIPFLILGFIEFLKKINNKYVLYTILIFSLLISLRFGYLPFSPYSKYYMKFNTKKYKDFLKIKNKISGENTSILTSEFLATYFIKNPNLYVYDKRMDFNKYINRIKFILAFKKDKYKFQKLIELNKYKILSMTENFILYIKCTQS